MFVGALKKGLQSALTVVGLFLILFIALSAFFVNSSSSIDSRNILYTLMASSAPPFFLVIFINSIVLAAGIFLISAFTIRHEIVEKQNYIPAFLYLFFSGLLLTRDLVHPALMANIFVLLSLNSLADTYRKENVLPKLFNAAVYCCLAFFFYLNYSVLILLFFISLIMLRAFSWREWMVSIFGFAAPVFIYACLGYLLNFDFFALFRDMFGLFTFFQSPLLSEYAYPLLFCILILLLLTALKHASQGLGSKIKTQKGMGLVYWFLLLSLVNFFSQRNDIYFPLVGSIIPLSILFSDYFYNIRQLKIANTLFFILIVSGSLLVLMRLGVI